MTVLRRAVLAACAALAVATVSPLAPAVAAGTAVAAPDISVSNIRAHLTQLQSIASQNGGHRAAGGGYAASVSYLEQRLRTAGYTVRRQTCPSCAGQPQNLIADWPGGDPTSVIMLGAHLDSVRVGPGINDNGTGSAAVLEVALTLARTNPTLAKHVRFGWWADEESGLRGSQYYVSTLSAADRAAIDAYLNFDMVGSRNWGYFVYDDVPSIRAEFDAYFQSVGQPTEADTEGDGRSDHSSFARYGIPVGGLFTGAGSTKTAAQQRKWGGTAGAPFDPCYHRACDTTANVADTPLNTVADAIAHVLWQLAVEQDQPPADNDFSMSLRPAEVTVAPAGSVPVDVTTTVTEGVAQPVTLLTDGLPAGATARFDPSSIQSGGSAVLTITTTAATPTGTTQVTVTGDGSDADRAVTLRLTVGDDDNPPGCAAEPWLAATAYVPGDLVAHNGRRWTATWYSTGAEPGAPGSWAVWRDDGAC